MKHARRYELPSAAPETRVKRRLAVLPSLLINQLVTVPSSGKWEKLSYVDRPYLRQQIDSFPEHPRHLYLYGRQSEKSTSLSAQILAYTTLLNITWQYVSATMEQAREFSQWKLDGPIRDSDILSGIFDMSGANRPFSVKRKENYMGGRVLIGTGYGDASRIRGNPADGLSLDEISLIDIDTIGILRECITHSGYGWMIHAGTPLSTDNPLWILWSEQSQQNEWAIPCNRHSPVVWNILTPENLTPTGIVCSRCGKPIDTCDGSWLTTVSPTDYTYKAFRIPQVATKFAKYGDIWARMVNDPINTMRESFAYSVEDAKDVFPDTVIAEMSDPNLVVSPEVWMPQSTNRGLFAGLDWAQDGKASTVLTFGGYIKDDIWAWLGGVRFRSNSLDDFKTLLGILDSLNFIALVADHGAGFERNQHLMARYGYPKFQECEYLRQEETLAIGQHTMRIKVNRNEILNKFVNHIIMNPGKFRLPRRADMERLHWWQDLRAVLREANKLGQVQFVKRSGKTDDFFHSMFYSFLASYFVHPRLDVLGPVTFKQDLTIPQN